ncbi:MAG: hypothetical protein SFU25_06755 [Candidatus Caenarcaniphilales bacterium]|nr:hypothetical protein [Candidatus Caenarcaniphilales bacterium]
MTHNNSIQSSGYPGAINIGKRGRATINNNTTININIGNSNQADSWNGRSQPVVYNQNSVRGNAAGNDSARPTLQMVHQALGAYLGNGFQQHPHHQHYHPHYHSHHQMADNSHGYTSSDGNNCGSRTINWPRRESYGADSSIYAQGQANAAVTIRIS